MASRKQSDKQWIQNFEILLAFIAGLLVAGIVSGPAGYWFGDSEVRREAIEEGVGAWSEDGDFEWLPVRPSEDDRRRWWRLRN